MNKKKEQFWKEVQESLNNGIDATCMKCNGDAKIYPGGLFCQNCSEPGMLDFVKSYSKTNGGYQKIPNVEST